MSQGMISNYELGDEILIDMYDIYSLAIEMNKSPNIVKSWTTEDHEWLKTVLTVQANIIKSKGK